MHFCRRARQARARGANCDSNPLPRGAAEPGARSRRALPLALAALGNLEPNRCPLRPGSAATGRGRGAGFLASDPGRPLEREEGEEVGAAGGQPESGAKRRRRRRPRGGEEERGGREGEAPARRTARGRAKRGPGREGWVGGRVGGERESNSRTRPERPALRAQAARLRQAPETGGCGGRGLCPSPIPRSGSEVSPARAATAQHRAPLSPKWLRYSESRPAGVRTWAGAAALSRCWSAGAPSTKA